MARDYTKEFHEMFSDVPKKWTTAASTSTVPDFEGLKKPSLDSLLDALARFQPEPFGEIMRKCGCPPEQGWIVVLPQRFCEPGLPLPPYVRVSDILREPVVMNPQRCGIEPSPQPNVPEDPQ